MKPALVILAAGASRRLGECKALVDLGGQSALERLLAAGRACDDVAPLVVTGAHHDAIRGHAPAEVRLLFNPDWEQGRSAGVVLARRAHPDRDLLIWPVDCPLVSEAVVTALVRAWSEAGAPARGWLAPSIAVRGSPRHGHPVVVGRGLLEDLAGLPPRTPLRALRAGADPLWDLPTHDPAVLDDLDDPGDLARLRARFGLEGPPGRGRG